MSIYVPLGESAITRQENQHLVELIGEFGAETLRTPDFDRATSMIASATDFGEQVGSEANYMASRLGRDVLLLCSTISRRDELIHSLGTRDYSIMAATDETVRRSAVQVHIDSQKILATMLERGIKNRRD